jgi:hypothetical protein
MSIMAVTSSTYTIRQYQTNWHGKYISSGCPGYYLDLNWGNSANSLQLREYGEMAEFMARSMIALMAGPMAEYCFGYLITQARSPLELIIMRC